MPKAVYHLFFVQLLTISATELTGPFWPFYMRELTNSNEFYSLALVLVYLLPMLGVALTSVMWGKLADKFGRKPMLVRAISVLIITQILIGLSDSLVTVLTLRFIQGAGAGYIAAAQAYGAVSVVFKDKAKLFTYLQAFTNLGSLVGATLGGPIFQFTSFATLNYLTALVCLFSACWAIVFLPKESQQTLSNTTNPPQQSEDLSSGFVPSSIASTLTTGLFLTLALLLISRMQVLPVYSDYMQQILSVPYWQIGLAYGAWSVGFICFARFWANLFSDFNWQQSLKRLLWVIVSCGIISLSISSVRDYWIFLAGYFIWGGLLAGTAPIVLTMISKAKQAHEQGRTIGMAQRSQQLGNVTGVTLGATGAYFIGLEHLYLAVAIGYGVTLVFALALYRLLRQRLQSHQQSYQS